jgi:hypothetical protein
VAIVFRFSLWWLERKETKPWIAFHLTKSLDLLLCSFPIFRICIYAIDNLVENGYYETFD